MEKEQAGQPGEQKKQEAKKEEEGGSEGRWKKRGKVEDRETRMRMPGGAKERERSGKEGSSEQTKRTAASERRG